VNIEKTTLMWFPLHYHEVLAPPLKPFLLMHMF